MASKPDWLGLVGALQELHRVLMERAKRDYEREHSVVLSATELLRLLTMDADFEWLRRLSELMADIDVVQELVPPPADDLSAIVRAAVEHLITVSQESGRGDAFALHYWPYVQDDPHVAIAHAAVKQVIAAWPRLKQESGSADLLHARHLLAEKARHNVRGS